MTVSDKLQLIAENEKKVYDAGYEAGKVAGGGGDYDTGYAAGYEAGMSEGIEVGHANGIEDGKQEATETLTETVLTDCNAVITEHLPAAETLDELPVKISDMYGVGYTTGSDEGFAMGQQIGWDSGVEKGKQEAYDAFWDEYQDNGNRKVYSHAFAGYGWTENTCRPKYDIQPTNAERMFALCGIDGDLDEVLGVKIDFSKCTNMTYTFYQAGVTDKRTMNITLGTIDLSAATDVTSVFNGIGVVGIKALVPPTIEMRNICFQAGLKDLTVVGQFVAGVNLSRCSKLTRSSIESVMTALSDAVTGQTVTFNKAAVEAAFSAEEWAALTASKPNWSIVLAE